jgi:hypothetical protein
VANIFRSRRESGARKWCGYATAAGLAVLLAAGNCIGWRKYSELQAQRAQAFSDAVLDATDSARPDRLWIWGRQQLRCRFRAAACGPPRTKPGLSPLDAIAPTARARPFREAATLLAATHLVDTADQAEINAAWSRTAA